MSATIHHSPRSRATLFAAAASATLLAGAARATIIYDNAGAATKASDPVAFAGPLYDLFTTGAGPVRLDFIGAVLSALPSATGGLGYINVDLLTDNDGKPGGSIGGAGVSLFDSDLTPIPFEHLVPISGQILKAHTRYWLEMYSPDGSSMAQWGFSDDTDGVGVVKEYFENSTGLFANAEFDPYQMEIGVSPAGVPEVGTWAVMLVGLGLLGATMRGRRPTLSQSAARPST